MYGKGTVMTARIVAVLCVGLGSALGGMCRYAMTVWTGEKLGSGWPWGTLFVNVLGCLFIGFASGLLARMTPVSPVWRLLVCVGFCGGFTTFSTFAADGAALWRAEFPFQAIAYVTVSLLLGFVALWCGGVLGRCIG